MRTQRSALPWVMPQANTRRGRESSASLSPRPQPPPQLLPKHHPKPHPQIKPVKSSQIKSSQRHRDAVLAEPLTEP